MGVQGVSEHVTVGMAAHVALAHDPSLKSWKPVGLSQCSLSKCLPAPVCQAAGLQIREAELRKMGCGKGQLLRQPRWGIPASGSTTSVGAKRPLLPSFSLAFRTQSDHKL